VFVLKRHLRARLPFMQDWLQGNRGIPERLSACGKNNRNRWE
jgi:hypothetical protein